MNRKTWNANPSRDLSYTSLVIDEQNRAQHAHKITDTARFHCTPTNGNLAVVVPDIEEEGVRQTLPRHLQADTNTRTVFQDVFYRSKEGITEFVEDPSHQFAAVRALPHMPLDELATGDTRIRRLKPSYDSPLGPGYYEPDPTGERSMGTLTISPGDVHHTVQYARDPTRPSAVFVSPTRGRTAPDIAKEAAAPPVVSRMTEPDFAYWTSKGCWAPQGDRTIEAERWGKNVRELKPPAEDRPQTIYNPLVTTDGHPNSCEAYTAARLTPSYKVAFSSGLPRTMALPVGLKPDTRLQVKSYEDITAAKADVGPGSYNPEAPRMRSPNAAYDTAIPYYSLASGAPTERNGDGASSASSTASLAHLLPPQLQQQLAAAGTLSLLTPASSPSTPYGSARRGRGLAPLAVQHGGGGAGAYSAPTSPSALRAAAVRSDRMATAAMLASLPGPHGGAGGRDRGLAPSPLGTVSMYGGAGGAGSGAHYRGQQHPDHGGGGDDGGGRHGSPSWSRVQSAPASPNNVGSVSASMRAAQSKQFTKL